MLPREKLLTHGVKALDDRELIAVFLRTGSRRYSVIALAAVLLDEFKGLRGLLQADRHTLLSVPGIGPAKYAELAAARELCSRYLQAGIERGEAITDPDLTRQFLQLKLKHYRREVFSCLFLDNQHRLIEFQEMFFGTIDGASVHPREVVKRALETDAAAVIFAHNHPSGVAEPSQADRRITERLQAALALVDIRVLDHMVVGDTEVTSFAERGYL